MEIEGQYAGHTWTCGACQYQFTVPAGAPGVRPPMPPMPPIPNPPVTMTPTATSGKAIASLILGLFSVFACLTFLTGVPGIILGHMAQSEIGRRRGELGGGGLATAGLVFSYFGTFGMIFFVGILAPILLPALVRAREAARRASCQNNLKQMGLVFKMFANESRGEYWPMLSSEPGRLMVNASDIYDEYLIDATILICPSHPHGDELHQISDPLEMIDDHSYFYLGYVVTSDEEVLAFAEAYRQRIAEGLPFDEDLEVAPGTGSNGGDAFLRLREGVERQLGDIPGPTTAQGWQARIPVLIEPPDHHQPAGANVLYMDGHVGFFRYPGEWPMTETTINTLKELAEY